MVRLHLGVPGTSLPVAVVDRVALGPVLAQNGHGRRVSLMLSVLSRNLNAGGSRSFETF